MDDKGQKMSENIVAGDLWDSKMKSGTYIRNISGDFFFFFSFP